MNSVILEESIFYVVYERIYSVWWDLYKNVFKYELFSSSDSLNLNRVKNLLRILAVYVRRNILIRRISRNKRIARVRRYITLLNCESIANKFSQTLQYRPTRCGAIKNCYTNGGRDCDKLRTYWPHTMQSLLCERRTIA